jgi:hypothetical protein
MNRPLPYLLNGNPPIIEIASMDALKVDDLHSLPDGEILPADPNGYVESPYLWFEGTGPSSS